jgi:NAD(P)H-hydrate epimerase
MDAVASGSHALLTTAEMARADALMIAAGTPSFELMRRAAAAVATAADAMAPRGAPIVIVCGPGNNGGDGFVAARMLRERGREVDVVLVGERAALKGDAARAAALWDGAVHAPEAIGAVLGRVEVVVDALFGAGLSRPVMGAAADVIAAVNARGVPVLAVDVPSGVDGTTGACDGAVIDATRTVTFFRAKPGHYLFPGAAHIGTLEIADIGIPADVLDEIRPRAVRNGEAVWRRVWPALARDGHKYGRGHALVVSGPADRTGAARLGARGALRIGAGLVTLAGDPAATAVNAMHVTSIMLRRAVSSDDLADILGDARFTAALIGPAAGVSARTAEDVLAVLQAPAAVVLDADALTSFAAMPAAPRLGFLPARGGDENTADRLFAAVQARTAPVVVTPHEGEFRRLFGDVGGSKLERARAAATRSGAIVVLKGADTVIAAPDGRAAINADAPPWLATAGSGDVLAGMITGLLAQRMPPWEAACAAASLHGAAARAFGPGLIAEDLPDALPRVLARLV